MEKNVQLVLEKLSEVNVKDVERSTHIPADRIYKWLKGKGSPKIKDLNLLLQYFQIGTKSESHENITYKENIDRMALASPIDINQDESPYTESARKIPSSKAEQQDLCSRLEIMLDNQQNQIIEMLTATKRIKDYLDLLKMSMVN